MIEFRNVTKTYDTGTKTQKNRLDDDLSESVGHLFFHHEHLLFCQGLAFLIARIDTHTSHPLAYVQLSK